MCGIAGFIDRRITETGPGSPLQKMTDTLTHRGPDDEGHWHDAGVGLQFGFRRLAIVELSPHGSQPMLSPCGRYVVVFNGELYNHVDLKKKLTEREPDYVNQLEGHSDTAVLLAAVALLGIEAALKEFVGMFAFALWDRQTRRLYLARDRVGEKPLYYGWHRGVFLFGSELRALKRHPRWQGEVDRTSLTALLRHNYIPAPRSIYEGIYKLEPGHLLEIDALHFHAPSESAATQSRPYWDAREMAAIGLSDPFCGSDTEAIAALKQQLQETIALQRMADVPLGAFLSGGIDSSTIVAMMAEQSSQPIKTFSIGFQEEGYNEAPFAKAVAEHLKTDHYELYVSPEEAQAVIPNLPQLYDEPFADSSQVPTYLVSKIAREKVTVSLSGDGGDELFGGYDRYQLTQAIWKNVKRIPPSGRRLLSHLLLRIPPNLLSSLFATIPGLSKYQSKASAHRFAKLSDLLSSGHFEGLYQSVVSHWQHPETLVIQGKDPNTKLTDPSQWLDTPSVAERMMYLDLVSYLPEDILVKVDRASMAVSLESRAPFLDHRIVEMAWRLPLHLKIRDGVGKWILRQVLYQYVPKELVERPKKGFAIPIGPWLRGPLRDWAESLLAPNLLRQQGYFRPERIEEKWHQHLAGTHDWQYLLWDVLMFQAWSAAETTP